VGGPALIVAPVEVAKAEAAIAEVVASSTIFNNANELYKKAQLDLNNLRELYKKAQLDLNNLDYDFRAKVVCLKLDEAKLGFIKENIAKLQKNSFLMEKFNFQNNFIKKIEEQYIELGLQEANINNLILNINNVKIAIEAAKAVVDTFYFQIGEAESKLEIAEANADKSLLCLEEAEKFAAKPEAIAAKAVAADVVAEVPVANVIGGSSILWNIITAVDPGMAISAAASCVTNICSLKIFLILLKVFIGGGSIVIFSGVVLHKIIRYYKYI